MRDFDHHCPWTGNCVARRNYKYFIGFVFSVTVLSLLVFGVSLSVLIFRLNDDASNQTILVLLPPLLLVIVSIIAAISLISLVTYHLFLISKGLTTNEHMRGISQSSESISCYGHWRHFLFDPQPKSDVPRQDDWLTDAEALHSTSLDPETLFSSSSSSSAITESSRWKDEQAANMF